MFPRTDLSTRYYVVVFFFFFLNVGKTCVFFGGDWRFISKASFWVLGFGCFLKMEALGFCGLS